MTTHAGSDPSLPRSAPGSSLPGNRAASSLGPVVFDGRYIQDRYHGIGRYAFHLLLELAGLLPSQRFLVLRDPSLADSRFDWSSLSALPNVRVRDVAAPPFSAREQTVVPFLREVRKSRIYHTPYFALPWLMTAPSLVTVHDCIFEHNAQYMPRRWARLYYRVLMAASMSRARAVLVPSRATARDVRRFYRVPARKLVVTPEAADTGFRPLNNQALLEQIRHRYNLPERFVLAVGARRPHKNFGILVQAVARLDSAHLVFVGNADERFADDAALEARTLGDRVRFLGAVPEGDLPALYNLATALACPSLIEGFGLPVLESMASGTPVICSDITVFREVAADAALLVAPRDASAWSRALDRVLATEDLRIGLREAGLERASRFTWVRAAEALLPLYQRLLFSPT